jgi:hypothetical protein
LRLEPEASAFLRWARGLTADVTSAGLLAACSGDEEFMSARNEGEAFEDGERAAFTQIANLTLELKCFCYFAATLIDYVDTTRFSHLQGADVSADTSAWLDIESLMEARAAASANPRVGWGLISACRSLQARATLDLPL